jgi:hypothetical protein
VLYVEGEALLLLLDAKGIAVHSGSSCTADTQEPSHVLAAMGAMTHGSVRVSFLADAVDADVDRLLEVLPAAVADLREMADLDSQAVDRATEGSGRRGPGNPEGVPRTVGRGPGNPEGVPRSFDPGSQRSAPVHREGR